ncbi:uncharacterized protein LOC130106735 [Lampris incognitus]|uniref:uncharacterized protein LOC130106735 n=1 Tax=Lampris incognitus TaxID=2546036 RepID=UPI0024B4EDD0|nr:uncharacterized protein LOC130106735 [Lampris incognitus]
MLSLTLILVLLTAVHSGEGWNNDWDRPLHFVCRSGQVLSRIASYHNNQKEDRRWSLSCKSLPNTQKCYWSNFVNGFDKNVDFSCRQNYVVAGVYSYHSNSHEDRRWRFYCCTAPQFETSNCQETTWMNYWDEYFNWYVPGANYLTGLKSYHRNDKEDRRWRFKYCTGQTRDTRTSSNSDVMSKILNVNKVVSKAFTEGDVAVASNRNARICNNCKWQKSSTEVEIPYTISSSFNSYHKSVIERTMRTFSCNTCVRFVHRRNQNNYISIVNKNGCWSHVGRTGGGQELSLNVHGCVYHGIIQHELIHALGFWHEQSRSDRDHYVRINWENIPTHNRHNFNRHTTNNLNTPYDYSSVMHYGKTAFSKNGRDTITPLRSNVRIGQRDGMSELDILKINRLYNCKSYLPRSSYWDNNWDGVLSHQCPPGQAVSRITSVHSNQREDRLWKFSCKALGTPKTCRWSGYVNDFDKDMNFQCPHNQVIAGAHSYHRNDKEDRRWRFYCCSFTGFVTFDCKPTPWVNYFDEYFSWPVPYGNFLTGVRSYHRNYQEDRRWCFRYCQGRSS